MFKSLFKTMVAFLAIAAMAIGPVRGQNSYNVTFGGFNNPYMNTTVSVASLPQTFTEIGGYYFYPWQVISDEGGCEFTSVSVTSDGNGKVSANMVDWSEMTITVTGTFEGTATIHVEGYNPEIGDVSRDITVSCVAAPVPITVRMAEGTEDAANWTLASGNASVPGTQVLENVMSGSQVTATYNGTTKKVKSVKAVKWINPVTVPLTVEALTDGTVKVTAPKSGMKYSKNGGEKIALTVTISIDVNAGDKVAFYGTATSYNGTRISGGSADVKVYGNIMSLIDEENFATATTLTVISAFRNFFSSYSKLTDASGLLLPATTLTVSCYQSMFSSCYGLTAGPELLPATELADLCYQQMFSNCTTLVAAPALPATTLAENCYRSMFYSCKSLTTAPALPATTLAPYCYQQMFGSCSNLTTAPALPATTLAPYCYQQMFSNCTTLVAAPALPATELANYCYAYMFYSCSNLTTAPALPATELANDCYQSMFSSCYSLAAAPELPATTMAPECYTTMFYNCTTLTAVPVLPATTLATYCYNCMFQGCTGLTTVPSELLPATTLAPNCYYGMFQGCTNLTTGPELPATTLTDYCYGDMFRNCSNLANVTCLATSGAGGSSTNRWLLDAGTQATGTKTFTAATAANWPEGVNGIPDGWTRVNAQ